MKQKQLLWPVAMFSSFSAMAQVPAEPQLLPIISVQALPEQTDLLKTPASIQKIVLPESQQNARVNLSEVLQGTAGLQINNRENYAQDLQISMRGFGARSTFGVRGIRLYVDGIPASMPDGQGQTSNIDLNSLDHVEVLGGPFSSLYGNSSGGAILTTSKQGEGPDSIEVGYNTGRYNKNQANVVVQGGAKSANEPSYLISSSYFGTDGYREHSAADKSLTNAKLTWDLDDGSKINWIINHVDMEADDPQGLTRAQWQENPRQQVAYLKQFDARKEIKQTQTGFTWSKPINDQNELYAMVYAGTRNVTQYQSIPKSTQDNVRHAGGVIDFSRDYYGADLRWTVKDLIENSSVSVGVALDRMIEDRQGYENYVLVNNTPHYGVQGDLRRNEKNTLWNIDPYIQASWQFLPNWNMTTGVRYSNVHYQSKDYYLENGNDSGSTEYQKVLPSFALGWNIRPHLYGYASYGKGFETPTFTEMAYNTDPNQAGMNLDLTAASSDNYELGLKSQYSSGLFTAALFKTETKNDIVSAGTRNGRATYRNADQTTRKGFELSWQQKIWRELKLQSSYSYLDAVFDSNTPALVSSNVVYAQAIAKGNKIPGIAKNQAFMQIAWEPEQGLQAGAELRYLDKIFVDDLNSDAAPSSTIAAIRVGYVWKHQDWQVNSYARIDNLFDRNYVGSVIVNDGNKRYFEPASGRNLNVGLSVKKSF